MTQSDKIDELAKALIAAVFPPIPKTKTAQIGSYSYKYADLADIRAVTAPVLKESGLAVTQMTGYDEGRPTLTTMVLHASGQWIADTMLLPVPTNGTAQALGSAITYSRRYAYSAALGLVTEDDDDGAAASQPARGRSQGTTTRQAPVRANQQTGEITDDPATMDLRTVTAALEALKLPVTGNLAQKRLRLAEARAGVAPANVASNGSEMITEKQIGLVNILFDEKGFPPDPAERHRYEGFIVGREVASIHQLTRKEGHDLIEALKAEEVREAEQPSLAYADGEEPF